MKKTNSLFKQAVDGLRIKYKDINITYIDFAAELETRYFNSGKTIEELTVPCTCNPKQSEGLSCD